MPLAHRYEVIYTPTDIFMVMEYVPNGELFDLIVSKGKVRAGRAFRNADGACGASSPPCRRDPGASAVEVGEEAVVWVWVGDVVAAVHAFRSHGVRGRGFGGGCAAEECSVV